MLRASGNSVETVADLMQLDPKTVRRHFKRELANGKDRVRAH
jgi:DNA-binding CsgD family transcriptional regulator